MEPATEVAVCVRFSVASCASGPRRVRCSRSEWPADVGGELSSAGRARLTLAGEAGSLLQTAGPGDGGDGLAPGATCARCVLRPMMVSNRSC